MKYPRILASSGIIIGLLLISACGTLAIQIEPIPVTTLPGPTLTMEPPTQTSSPLPSTSLPTLQPTSAATASPLQLRPGTSLKIVSLKMLDDHDGWAVAEVDSDLFQHILYTNDGGNVWKDRTPLAALISPPENGLVADAFFGSLSNAWVSFSDRLPSGGQNETVVWYTTDSGITWEKSQPLDFGDVPMEFRNPSDLGFINASFGWVMVHLGAGMNHDYIAVFTTADGGKTWQRVLDPNNNADMMGCVKSGLTFNTTISGWLSTNCPGLMPKLVFYHTSDGGATWIDTGLPVPEGKLADFYAQSGIGCGIPQLDYSTARTLMLTLQCNNYNSNGAQAWLYTTGDGGNNWANYSLPLPYSKIIMLNPSEGFLLGAPTLDPTANGAVYHTTDGGQNWSLQTSTAWTGTPDFVDATTGWVIAVHNQVTAFVRSSDGGRTWAELKPVVGP
jgi:photosystem II stability/assembly factor-like uncharacterized protein